MKSQLDKLECNETTTLLELAVWKAACLINYQHPIKDLFELRDWWKPRLEGQQVGVPSPPPP